jgi:hypothetical protein
LAANRYLRIYLSDQHAIQTGVRELARRNGALAEEQAADLRELEAIMRRLGVRPSRVKTAAAIGGERLGRLKLNGRLVRRSPLSDLVELDYLALGVQAKLQLWENLRAHAEVDGLLARADDQLARLADLRAGARRFLD